MMKIAGECLQGIGAYWKEHRIAQICTSEDFLFLRNSRFV